MAETVDSMNGQPLPAPFQLTIDSILIEKVSRIQYFYKGMPIVFLDNKFFGAGNATNNLGYTISIAVHPNKPDDDFSGPFQHLKYLSTYVLVHVPNAQIKQLYPDLPLR